MTYISQNTNLSDFMYCKLSHTLAVWAAIKISFSVGFRMLHYDIHLRPVGAFCDWGGDGVVTWPLKLPSDKKLIPG